MDRTRKEVSIFLGVGVTAVVIDYIAYRGSAALIGQYDVGKTIGFLAGAVFAYFANRAWTFGHVETRRGAPVRFVALYLFALGANVLINHCTLNLFAAFKMRVVGAFLVATVVSATINFLGMKFFVFTARRVKA